MLGLRNKLSLTAGLALVLAACAAPAAPTPTAVLSPPTTAATVTATPPPTISVVPSAEPTPTTIGPTAAAGPALTAGQWNYLFYHPGRAQAVLVNGGPDRGKPAGDPLELWAWDGAAWTLISADPAGPRWRNFAGAAFDSARQVLVLHGGVHGRGAWRADTWEWDGAAWTEVTAPGPGPREGAEMAYDAARGQVLLFGGATEGALIAGDTWAGDGAAWTQAATTGPAPHFPNAMLYDPNRASGLLYGGHFVSDTTFEEYGDLWEWDGTAWRELLPPGPNPGYRIVSRLVWDPLDARALLFGGGAGSFLSDLWAWEGAQWAQIAPDGAPARSGLGGAYDAARNRLVAFGGVPRPGGAGVTETWEWDRHTWQCVQGCP